MKNLKYLKMKISAAVLLIAVITFSIITYNKAERIQDKPVIVHNLPYFQQPASELVKNKLANMTLREKIAQMIIASAVPQEYQNGSSDQKKFKRLCEETKVGGFIFFLSLIHISEPTRPY